MEEFLPSYDDPVVSILLLLGIIFIVSVASYAYSIYKQERDQKELLDFIKSFDSKECQLDVANMPYDESIKKPLVLLALAYSKSGDYNKSINIYLYLLKHTKDNSILKELASAYFKAGFIQRALDIYLEILKKHPRDKEALYRLEYIYEMLGNLDKAKEVLEVIEAQNLSAKVLREHIKITKVLKAPKEKRFSALASMLKESNFRGAIIRELFKIDAKRAFRYYKSGDFEDLIDILFRLKKEVIDFEIVKSDHNLKALYFAKGYLNSFDRSDIFELNLLNSAKLSGFNDATLQFTYICSECKSRFPLEFKRCPNCHRAHRLKVEVDIAKVKRDKYLY